MKSGKVSAHQFVASCAILAYKFNERHPRMLLQTDKLLAAGIPAFLWGDSYSKARGDTICEPALARPVNFTSTRQGTQSAFYY